MYGAGHQHALAIVCWENFTCLILFQVISPRLGHKARRQIGENIHGVHSRTEVVILMLCDYEVLWHSSKKKKPLRLHFIFGGLDKLLGTISLVKRLKLSG